MAFEELTCSILDYAIANATITELLKIENRGTKWRLEWLAYGSSTDADFFLVEGTPSTMNLFDETLKRRCFIGNLKTNHHELANADRNPKAKYYADMVDQLNVSIYLLHCMDLSGTKTYSGSRI